MTNFYSPFRAVCQGLFVLAALSSPLASRAQYTPGNLVVLRIGDGLTSLTGNSGAAAPVALAEYTPAGVLRSTVSLPSTGPDNKLTNTGNAQSEGMLTLSANGQYLLTTGYNAAAGTAAVSGTTSAATPRTVARIDGNRAFDISTALTNAYSGSTIRSAASLDGTSFFLSGSMGGIRYATMGTTAASSISTTVASTRVMRIYRNRVYFSTSTGNTPGIYVVDVATNTAPGQTATSFLPTGGTGAASPYGFILLDRSRDVPGFDAAYVADDGIGSAAGGIQKWSFDGTAWTKRGSIGTAFRGLTGTLNPDGSVILYATTNTSAGGNDLVTVTDTNPYDAAPSTTAVSVVATAVPNVAFKGVDFAPGTAVVLPVVLTGFAATRAAGNVQLRWATASETNSAHFVVERSPDGQAFAAVATVAAAGTSQQARTYAHLDAAPANARYYRLRQVDLDGASRYSPVVAVSSGGPELALHPSPASEQLYVTTELATPYTVRTALGQPVRAGITAAGISPVPVAGLPAGIYLFELHADTGRVVRRFVKE